MGLTVRSFMVSLPSLTPESTRCPGMRHSWLAVCDCSSLSRRACLCCFSPPVLSPPRWIALGLAVCMLVASLLEALTVNVYFNILFRCGPGGRACSRNVAGC
jgi:hypothetical protein